MLTQRDAHVRGRDLARPTIHRIQQRRCHRFTAERSRARVLPRYVAFLAKYLLERLDAFYRWGVERFVRPDPAKWSSFRLASGNRQKPKVRRPDKLAEWKDTAAMWKDDEGEPILSVVAHWKINVTWCNLLARISYWLDSPSPGGIHPPCHVN